MGEPDTKATRRAARDRVAVYHQEQLLGLLEHRFLLKGGVAMELRLQLQARATKDTDIIVIPVAGVSVVDACARERAFPGVAARKA